MGIVAILVVAFAGFDFDIDVGAVSGEVEDFAQGWYLLWFGPAAGEVCGGIEAAQIGEVEVEDVAMAVGAFVDGVVVKDDCAAIAAHVNIKFYGVDWQGEGVAKGGECVLRGEMGAAAVGNALYVVIHRVVAFRWSHFWVVYRINHITRSGMDGRVQGECMKILLYI